MNFAKVKRPVATESWTRRGLIRALAAVPLAALAGCGGQRHIAGRSTVVRRRLIDAHCHIFNVTDLPASSFAQQVFFRDYVETITPTPAQLALRGILRSIENIVSLRVVRAGNEADIPPGTKTLLMEEPDLTPEEERAIEAERKRAEKALRRLEEQAKFLGCPGPGASPSLESVVRWLKSLRSSRARMAAELVTAHQASGFTAELLVPALVDYSNWLQQDLTSPLPDQVRALGTVSSNVSLPPVHGYVAFDPLRRALVRNGTATVDGSWDPLTLGREALQEHGFIGVKIYPPMGFRPSGNEAGGEPYMPSLVRAFGSTAHLGKELDTSLDELWALCTELDAPVMAHAAESNAAGRGYARRADPSWWFPVLEQHKSLRVLLGHFGRFRSFAAASGQSENCAVDVPFEHTWEAAIGRFVQRNPGRLFSDISYLSEIFRSGERRRAVERLQRYLEFDADGRHLVFGSDWVMLGIEKEYRRHGGYPHRIVSFLADAGLGPEAIDGIMFGNALRYLGLRPGSGVTDRLLEFYRRHSLPPERMPVLAAAAGDSNQPFT